VYTSKGVPCLISTFLPCLIRPMGPNRTVRATVAPTLASPSLPFVPRLRSQSLLRLERHVDRCCPAVTYG
jgi:hypothetical protein